MWLLLLLKQIYYLEHDLAKRVMKRSSLYSVHFRPIIVGHRGSGLATCINQKTYRLLSAAYDLIRIHIAVLYTTRLLALHL